MQIYTSYFMRQRKMELEDAAYVSIAVGNPRYAVPYKIVNAKSLKPYGIFGTYHGEEYRQKYFERLDFFGVDMILKELMEVSEGHENVILMCHEKNEDECHRRMFAEWWFKNTGEYIPEIGKEEKQKKELTQYDLFGIM